MSNPTPIEYKVKRNTLGQLRSVYPCPGCKAPLQSALTDAGTSQPCPDCGTVHTVPGVKERDAEAAKTREAQEAKAAAESEKTRERARVRELNEQTARKEDIAKAEEAKREYRRKTAQGLHVKRRAPETAGLVVSMVVFALLGTVALIAAIAMNTSISTTSDIIGFPSRVENIGLLNTRLCWTVLGCGLWIAAIICGVGFSIGGEINQSGHDLLMILNSRVDRANDSPKSSEDEG